MIKLNIGLERSAKFGASGENSLEAVCAILDKHCAEWRDLKVEQSATEKTVIVNVAIDSRTIIITTGYRPPKYMEINKNNFDSIVNNL